MSRDKRVLSELKDDEIYVGLKVRSLNTKKRGVVINVSYYAESRDDHLCVDIAWEEGPGFHPCSYFDNMKLDLVYPSSAQRKVLNQVEVL